MRGHGDAVDVVRVRKSHADKRDEERHYQTTYLRLTWREGGTVRDETVAGLSTLLEAVIAAIQAGLKGQQLVPVDAHATVIRSLPHGPVANCVVPGNTADPTSFEQIAIKMKTVFGASDMGMVGNPGMITSARIDQLRDLGGLGWVGGWVNALRSVQITGLMTPDGPVQQTWWTTFVFSTMVFAAA